MRPKAKAILSRMVAGERVSVQSVIRKLGTTEARAYISDIRHAGFNVLDEKITYGDTWYKEWWLNGKERQRAQIYLNKIQTL